MKAGIKDLAILGAEALIDKAPDIINLVNKKKEEKTFFEKNKWWISLIILTIFVTKLNYIEMFKNVILNSTVNIVFGLIVFILVYLFLKEEKNAYRVDSKFTKFLIIAIIILGLINSFYHIGIAVYELINF